MRERGVRRCRGDGRAALALIPMASTPAIPPPSRRVRARRCQAVNACPCTFPSQEMLIPRRRGRRVPIPPANRRDPFGTDGRVTHRGVTLKGWTDARRLEAAHSVEPGPFPGLSESNVTIYVCACCYLCGGWFLDLPFFCLQGFETQRLNR
jgi:hypothetical protein